MSTSSSPRAPKIGHGHSKVIREAALHPCIVTNWTASATDDTITISGFFLISSSDTLHGDTDSFACHEPEEGIYLVLPEALKPKLVAVETVIDGNTWSPTYPPGSVSIPGLKPTEKSWVLLKETSFEYPKNLRVMTPTFVHVSNGNFC